MSSSQRRRSSGTLAAMRAAAVLVVVMAWLGAALACGGKVLDGACTPANAGGCSCNTEVDGGAAIQGEVPSCSSNVGSSNSCSTVMGGIGFTPIHVCLDCGSRGIGTLWTCTQNGWEAAGEYECGQ